jgi:Na+/phosphate symporter
MALLNLISAIILILLGMRYLRKGLDRLFGNQLVEWLQETAKNRYKGFFAGMVAGLISPSSSAIAVLSVQILNQSALTAGRMLAVVLGANVGLTVIVQLITFDLQDFAGAFIVAGGIGFLFLHRAIFRGTGQILLGLGPRFLGDEYHRQHRETGRHQPRDEGVIFYQTCMTGLSQFKPNSKIIWSKSPMRALATKTLIGGSISSTIHKNWSSWRP